MSVAGILGTNGKISTTYLPTGPAPAHPYVENPFQDDVDGGQQELTNLRELQVGSTTAPNFTVSAPGPSSGSVQVNCDATPGNGLAVAPNNQTTGHGGISLSNGTASINPTEYIIYNPSTSGGGIGLSAGHLQIFGLAVGSKRIFDAQVDGDSIILGDDTVVGGAVVAIAGSSGASRIYDTTYNPTITITPVASGTGNIETTTALTSIPAGTYQLQLTAETISPPLANVNLNLLATAPPSSAVINYSCGGITSTGTNTNVLGINSGFFTFAGGDLTVRVESSGANWTASEWAVQLVRFG